MNHFPVRRLVASTLSLSLIIACPGLAPYAAAQSIRSAPAASANAGAPVLPAFSPVGGAALGVQSLTPSAAGLSSVLSAPAAPTPVVSILAAPVNAAAAVAPLKTISLNAAPALSVRAAAPARAVSAAARTAAAALEKAGPIADASPASASGVGLALEEILTGAASARRGSDLSAPALGEWGGLNESRQLARPAGDAIREAAAASVQDSGVPPAPRADLTPAPKKSDGPFWPRLLTGALALVPGILLGLPLIGASAYAVGGLVIASSLSLAVMPFLSENSPKALRAAPGLILAALGVATAGIALSLTFGLGVAVAPALAWTGAFALVGGWGLTRYGLGKGEGRYGSYGSPETLSAFFGGLASLTGVALAASTPLGWAATALLWLSYPLAAMLWFHLPGWVGRGMMSAFAGVWHGILGLSRVLTSTDRDTTVLDRLGKFSERHWTSSKWNAVWLAVMWTPVVLAEAAMYALSAAGGLAVGVATAPVNFLWGASAKLWPGSKLNVYFAEAARLVFDNVQNGKVARFNPLAAKLIPFANSPKLFVSVAGAFGLKALQLGWFAYAVVAAPLLSVAGLLAAFGRLGAYNEERHARGSLSINREDSPSEKPNQPTEPEPGPPSKNSLVPKLIATAIALIPVYFFGLPVLAGASFIQIPLYFGLMLPLAAMPFLGKAPLWAKSFAGRALFYNGLFLLINGSAIWVGILALLGGWGFQRWVKSTSEKKGGSFDEAELGAFFGALSAAAAVGAAWAGFFGGWVGWGTIALAAATSPFLLMHLPSWVWQGLLGVFKSFARSTGAYLDSAEFWHKDTEFQSNLSKHASYWLDKTYWNGVWLSAIWVPVGLIMAAEFVLSLALGAITGLIRLPFAFAAAAYDDAKPGSKAARFTAALMNGWKASSEDSKALYVRMVSGLRPAIDEAAPVTGRPTVKAAGALLLARIVQLLWLAGVLAMTFSGASFLYGVYRGLRAAFAK